MTRDNTRYLYSYRFLIDAEGRCENYWLDGYVTMNEPTDYFVVERKLKQQLKDDGELVLDLVIGKPVGFVDVIG